MVVEFALPGPDALGVVLDNIATSASPAKPEGNERETLLDAAGGLTSVEAENAFALAELAEFKCRQGHCEIPNTWKENQPLVSWVPRQRRNRAKLLGQKRRKLEALGSRWNRRQSHWDRRLAELKELKRKHGHCNVTRNPDPASRFGCAHHRPHPGAKPQLSSAVPSFSMTIGDEESPTPMGIRQKTTMSFIG